MSVTSIPFVKNEEWHLRMLALEIAAKAVAGNCHNQQASQIADKTQEVADHLYRNYISKL